MSARRFALAGVMTSAVNILLAIVRSKVVAVRLGPEGVGVTAEVTQVVTFATIVAGVATGPALMRWLSQSTRDADDDRFGRGFANSLWMATAFALAGGLIAWAIAPWVMPAFGVPLRLYALLQVIGTTLTTLSGVLTTVLIARADLRAMTISSIVGTVTGGLATVALVWFFGLTGQFVATAVSAALTVTAGWFFARRHPIRLAATVDREFVREAFSIGTSTLIAGFFAQSLWSTIRATLQSAGGVEGAKWNGHYQAASTIGTTYFAMLLSGLGSYYYPRFASAANAEELRAEVSGAADFVLKIIVPVTFFAIALRGYVIHALYSSRFDLAIDILGFQFAGDVAKAVSWSYAGALPMRGRVRAFLITEASAFALGTPLYIVFIHRFGPLGAGVAYALTYLLYAVVAVYVTSRSCDLRMGGRHLVIAAVLTFAAAAFNVATARWTMLRWTVFPLGAAYLHWSGLAAAFFAKLRARRARLAAQAEAEEAPPSISS